MVQGKLVPPPMAVLEQVQVPRFISDAPLMVRVRARKSGRSGLPAPDVALFYRE